MGFKVQAWMRSLLVESASTSYANAALVVVAGCLLAPLVEELVFRGTMLEFFTKAKGMAAGGAVLLTSVLFALLHFELAALPIIFAFGCLLGALRIATASLQPCVLAHVTANVGAVGLALLAAR